MTRGFRNPYHKAIVNILDVHNLLIDKLNEAFEGHEITRQQYNVLRILKKEHPRPVSITTIKERMLDKMSDVSRIVDRLRSKGLAVRQDSLSDRRAADVTITEMGLKLFESMNEPSKLVDKYLQTLSVEECEKLNEMMDRIRSQIKGSA